MKKKEYKDMTSSERNLRTDAYDTEMVRYYLKDFPEPSVGTLMHVYKPPGPWEEEWDAFLKEDWHYKLKILKLATPDKNVVLDGLRKVSLPQLTIDASTEAIELEPTQAVSISEIKPYAEFITYKCLTCQEVFTFPRDLAGAKPKKKCCTDQNIVEVTNITKDAVDSQWVKVQELQHDATTTDLPLMLNCLLKGKEWMWRIKFHERVSLIGMLRYSIIKNPKDGSRDYQPYFEVFGVKKLDPEAHITLSESDIQYIKSEMDKPQFYEKLVASFAPHIYGMEPFKEAILLILASIKLPKPGRLLMVTDPGMAKSVFLRYICSMVSRAEHTQMGRASSPGLTASAEIDKETGRRYIRGGAAVWAHEGLLCIDELQMGQEKDFMALNEFLESGTIKYSMASVRGSLDANCAVIMACNPHNGRFSGSDESLTETLKFMGNAVHAFGSRITLILMRRDNNTDEEERKIVRHMYRHNPNDPLFMDRYYENWYDENEPITIETPLKGFTITMASEKFGTKWIRKILKYITNYVQVEPMSPEYEEALIENYMKNRKDVVSSTNKLIGKRFFGYEMVLAQYMARLQGLSQPTSADLKRAIDLLEKTMSVAAFDPKTGQIDPNSFNNSLPAREIEKMVKEDQLVEAMKMAMEETDPATNKKKGYFTVEDVIYQLDIVPHGRSKWRNDSEIERVINMWNAKGKLMEKGQGRYILT